MKHSNLTRKILFLNDRGGKRSHFFAFLRRQWLRREKNEKNEQKKKKKSEKTLYG